MGEFVKQFEIWSGNPAYWVGVFFAIGYVSMCFHELGHALFAKLVGAQVTRLDFGKPAIKIGAVFGVEIRIGLPLGGSCSHKWNLVDNSTPFRSIPISIGGWVVDCLVLVLITIFLQEHTNQGFLYITVVYLWLKVLVGVTPITRDGRNLLTDLRLAFEITKDRISAVIR